MILVLWAVNYCSEHQSATETEQQKNARLHTEYENKIRKDIYEEHKASVKFKLEEERYPWGLVVRASKEEKDLWLNGYLKNGGSITKYSRQDFADGAYIVKENFRLGIDETGITTFTMDKTPIDDKPVTIVIIPDDVKYVIVPATVAYLFDSFLPSKWQIGPND